MLQAQELFKLSNLVRAKDSVLADKIITLSDSVDLEIITPEEAEGLINLAKDLSRSTIFPVAEIEAAPKAIIPITISDLAQFEKDLGLVIKPNSVTKKYDVFDSKGTHKLEFEFNADKEEIVRQLNVIQ